MCVCVTRAHFPACKERSLPVDHRVGGKECPPSPPANVVEALSFKKAQEKVKAAVKPIIVTDPTVKFLEIEKDKQSIEESHCEVKRMGHPAHTQLDDNGANHGVTTKSLPMKKKEEKALSRTSEIEKKGKGKTTVQPPNARDEAIISHKSKSKNSKHLEKAECAGSQFPGEETGPRVSFPEEEKPPSKEQDEDEPSASSSNKRFGKLG